MKKIYLIGSLISVLISGCYKDKTTTTQVISLIKTTKSWNGSPLPQYPEGTPEVTILKITIPPKTKLPLHRHPEINAGVLLKGALTVISEANDTLYLKEGDPIVELVNSWHFGKNEGNKPAEIVVFYAGVQGSPITILKDKDGHSH
ncbi:cupin domain-containing protein [Aquimarina hainanensis]|uniref:Cupin domain-containing protein n=1 Tax=Aquimarina hainanensis TaxID=1578017 RepID=A0ABW5N4P4_9FLAO|nr:cupin domain-containing protein [Aquimarina sp. TRL1]QKX06088.1 cupin domain-containing protein [Aquimarina sp. TRL1]